MNRRAIPSTWSPRVRQSRLGLIVSALLLWMSVQPVSAQQGLSAWDVARLKVATAGAIAPEGDLVAFARTFQRNPLDEPDGPAWTELHVVDREGRERPFVTGRVNVAGVAWTPDGSAISFLAQREGDQNRALYAIPRAGGEARKVVSHATDIRQYSWSPDGRRVAFLATEARPEARRERERQGFNQIVYEESAEPVKVWVADVPASGASTTARALDLDGTAWSVAWSPTDARLAVTLSPNNLIDEFYVRRKIHVVDADSGDELARFDNPGKIGQIDWSPDGAHLAVIGTVEARDPMEGRLMVAPAGGGTLRDVLSPWDEGHASSFAWQDASTLLFLASEGVGQFMGRVGLQGGRFERLHEQDRFIAAELRLSKDGRTASVLADTPAHPAEVFVTGTGTVSFERLTRSNPWLDDRELAPQEVVSYPSRDGLTLQGLLIRPLGEQTGRRYPLIVVVHGGPEAHYSNGWLTGYSAPGQVGAAEGFAVFYPNYRGSTGRGVEFSLTSQGDPAGKEFDDLVDGVDHLVETGLVDREKVGITGGSYGGFATAWAATYYSERFAAAVMFVGISDLVSKFGTSDIPFELHQVHYRRWPWEDWRFFLERSPIFHVDKAETPLLILHGEEDPRVHPGQSLELYRYMKVRTDTPVRLVLYPGEGHGNRRAASRLDYSLRLMRWMEHYLKGPGGEPPPYELSYEEEGAVSPSEETQEAPAGTAGTVPQR